MFKRIVETTKEKPSLRFYIEPLEPRYMLSGNIVATLIGGDLWIQGDELDNDISLEIIEDQVVLVGNADTTINGSESSFVVSEGDNSVDKIFASLRDGDDQFIVGSGVQVTDSTHIITGDGNDTIGLDGLQSNDPVWIFSGSGNDAVAVNDGQLDRLYVDTGSGADLISIEGTEVADKTRLITGSGDDEVVVRDATLDDKVVVRTNSGDDSLVIENTQVNDRLVVSGGSGDDFVRIDDTTIDGRTRLFQNSGDDNVQILGTSVLNGSVQVFGSSGTDQQEISATVTGETPSVFSFADDPVDVGLVDTRIDSADTGAIASASQLQQTLFGTTGTSTPETPVATLSLTLDTSVNDLTPSNGIDIVTSPDFQIAGQTGAGATVEVDVNGDGTFDDGTTIADADGNFDISTILTNDQNNFGENQIAVRATDADGQQVIESTSVHFATGTVVRNTTSLGDFDIELLDEDAPVTVDNFLGYLGDFENSIIHRAPGTGFVIQGGGFTVENGVVASVPTDPPIDSEFIPENSNLRGTLSTALLSGDPDSATSGFFINTSDNAFLDAAGHTVFGRVIGEGLDVVDAIDQLPDIDATQVNPAFGEIPLRDFVPFSQELTGTLSADLGATSVTGDGTLFTTELATGDVVQVNGNELTVGAIVSDTAFTIGGFGPVTPIDNAVGLINPPVEDDNFVFIDIDTL